MLSVSARMFRSLLFVCVVAMASDRAYAACYGADQQMSPQAVSDFMSNAAALLSNPENAQGGPSLIDTIRDLVASNPATLPLVIRLLASANEAQQKAIGTGLGLAANLCARPDPNFAADISEQLAKTTSDFAKTNYAAIIGKPTGSVAGGGGGGAGGFSGGAAGGSTTAVAGFSGGLPSSPQPFTSGGAFTTGNNYFSSTVAGAGSISSTTTTTATTASNSVSK